MAVKYSRVPTEEDHVVDIGNVSSAFDYTSAFEYGSEGVKGGQYKSAFTYNNSGKQHTVPIMDVEGQKSLMGSVVSPILTAFTYLLWLITLPLSAWFTIRIIKQYERIVVFRLGKLQKVKGPGLAFTLPCIDRIRNVDTRTKAFSVPPQKTITSDGATVEIGAEIYHQVYDAVKSVTCVQDCDHSIRALCQLALQKIVSKYTLQQATSDQGLIGRALSDEVNITTNEWGIKVSKVQLSTVKVIQEPNALLEGCNLTNAPLDWLGPLLFPPGTTQIPVKPLQDRGLLPQQAIPANPELANLANSALAAFAGVAGASASMPPASVQAVARKKISPQDVMDSVRPFLKPGLVSSVNAVFLFKVKGADGGEFYLDLKHGEGDVGEGRPPTGKPDVTLMLNSNDLDKLFSGDLSAFQAYVSGRLKIDGDLQAAMALQGIVENININK